MRVCNTCTEEKELSEYYSQNKFKKDGTAYIYYAPRCKECDKKAVRKRQLENHEEYKQYIKNYLKENKLDQDKRRWSWTARNKEYLQEYRLNYQRSNKEKLKSYALTRKVKNHEISEREWILCKEYFNNQCAYCGLLLEEHIKTHNQDFHKDHAICKGSNKIDNCLPACKNCNSKKWQYDLSDWYIETNPLFEESKLHKIMRWLEEDVNNLHKI